jgi:LysM repeat protein
MTLRERLQPYFQTPASFRLTATQAKDELGSVDLANLITAYFPTSKQLQIDNCTIPSGDDPVLWDGDAKLIEIQPAAFKTVRVKFATINNVVQAVLETSGLDSKWSFSSLSLALKDTNIAAFSFDTPILTLASNANINNRGQSLRFSGTPRAEGPIEPVKFMFRHLSSMSLTGKIELVSGNAIMSLDAKDPTPFSLGPLSATPSLRVRTAYVPPDSTTLYVTAANADATFALDGKSVTVSAALSTAKPKLLPLELVSPVSINSYNQLNALADGKVSFEAVVPTEVPKSTVLKLDELGVLVSADDSGYKVVNIYARVSLTPETPWPLLPNNTLTIKNIAVWFVVNDPKGAREVNVTIAGLFTIDEDSEYIISVRAPQLTVEGTLAPFSTIKIDRLVQHFLAPIFGPIRGFPELSVYQLDIAAEVRLGTFSLNAAIDSAWKVLDTSLVEIELTSIDAVIAYSSSDLALFFTAHWQFVFNPDHPDGILEFDTLARKTPGDNGWDLTLTQAPDTALDLIVVLKHFLSDTPTLPPFVPATFKIKDLFLTVNTKSGDYKISGVAVAAWKLNFIPGEPTLDVMASLTLESTTDPAALEETFAVRHFDPVSNVVRTTSGTFKGEVRVWDFKATVVYQFAKDNNTLTFEFIFRGVTIKCTRTTEKDKQGRDNTILRGQLLGVTLGNMIEFLVNLVDPNLGFQLESPWNVLNEINFDKLTLVINLTRKTISFTYAVKKDFGFINLDTIGLTYLNRGGRKTVDVKITGRFFDQTYKENNPLAWDLVNDPAPTPPGKGDQLLDLRYLGVGQNVGFRDARSFDSVQSVIENLQADFARVDDDQNPLLSPALEKLKFTGDGNWLIGADLTLIEAISLTVVFNDPTLYGLRVALSGDKVKSFSGLDFQILYKKVTDSIGVYHIVLTLPDAFRQFQFGAASITLPVITIDIYTNGNFRIDMGFPVGLDFSKSFCVQAGPFIGYGGFYFAVLNGATSTRVPRITNGTFSPVIEAGIALSVGLGRTIDKGVLSAGLTITMVAIIEGAFGWFNPNDRSVGTALFYSLQGSAAIIGKLYGKVNLSVIQAEVNVTAFAKVTLMMEAYKPIIVQLSLGVEVSVSVKILFFRVSFSFSTTLDFSFTIGSASTPPWLVDASQPPPLMLRQQVQTHRRLSGAQLQERLLPLLTSQGTFDWKPQSVFREIQPVELSLVPALTVASRDKVFATYIAAPDATAQPQYQVVMSLFARNSVPASARDARAVRAVNVPNAAATPFNLLVSGMLKWALAAYKRPTGVSVPPPSEYALASDLEAISSYLADPQQWQDVFTYDALTRFMELNYVLNITTPLGPSGLMHPQGMLESGEAAPEVSAAIFPMIPHLEMGPKGQATVPFWKYHCVDRDYEDALRKYYQQLRIQSGPSGTTGPLSAEERAKPKLRQADGPSGCEPGFESLSTFIFRDYFAMLAKGAVNSAVDLLKSYPYEPTGSTGMTGGSGPTGPPESLRSIADEFNGIEVEYRTRPGDTLGLIAGRFGVAPHEIQTANLKSANFKHHENLPPGMALRINTGVTPAAIANQNAGYPLHYVRSNPVRMTIDGVRHQVRGTTGGQSESLRTISNQYGMSGPTGPGSLFIFDAPTVPLRNPNATNDRLLQSGARLTIPARLFKVSSPLDNARALVAAFFFVRSLGQPQPSQTPWYSYVQFYNQWIQDHAGSDSTWTVPIVTIQNGALTITGTAQYVPQGAEGSDLAPDTRELAAGYFAMTQLNPAPFGEAFQQFQSLVSPTGPPQTYSIGQFPYTIQPGDTMASVAQRFGIPIEKLADFNANATGLMQPLAVMALPTLNYPIAKDDTLASVAAHFDLTLDNLADSVADNPGILQPYESGLTPLNIPDLPGRPTEKLLHDLVNLGRLNNVSGMVTRFLVHGMRVPNPESAAGPTFPPDTPLWGLYEMVGQQFPAPAGASAPSSEFNVKFTKGASADWICFKPAGPSGLSGPTGCREDLTVYLNPPFFKDAPSLQLDPQLLAGPAPLPLYRDTPKQYSLQGNIHWQSSTFVPLPGPTGPGQQQTGQPSIWNFPPTLRQIALQGPSGPTGAPQYQLISARLGDQTGDSNTPVSHYAWAATIDLRVQRVPLEGGDHMPNSYVLLGADQDGRDQLLSAWNFLLKIQPPYGKLFILYPPSVTSNNSTGLVSQSLDSERTFLLKTNLTTVTKSNQPLLAARLLTKPSGDFYARLEAIPDFLRLAWEASITGSGGFYLNYFTANGGAGLPDSLFASGGVATITLLILTAPQTQGLKPDLGLYPFNNCAVIGDNIDQNSAHLYVQALVGNSVRIASVPAGQAGFYLARRNPDPGTTGPGGPISPADQTRSLYNLVGFQLASNPYFLGSNQGLPVGPAETPVHGVSGPTGPNVWWYQQVLPIYKFGKTNDARYSAALPQPAENPYAGITGATGGALSEMKIALGFVDVYGNQLAPTGSSLSVTGPVGYIDDLIGISAWPGAGADFAFTPGPGGGVLLDTRVSLQLDKYSPSPSYGFEQSSSTAIADAQHYSQIFYQVQQPDLTFDLQTNLGTAQISSEELKVPLAAFVSKAKVFADTCAAQKQQEYVTRKDDRLKTIADTFSTTLSALVNENQHLRVASLFQGKIVQPFFTVAGPLNTLKMLAENQFATPYPPVCGPDGPPDCISMTRALGVCSIASSEEPTEPLTAVADENPELTPGQLLRQNRTVPLTPGLVLRTAQRTSPLSKETPNTLAAVAAALQCVVYGVVQDPETLQEIKIGLFIENYTASAVVAPNLDIEIEGITINTGTTPTLKSVEDAFSELELEQSDFVAKLQNVAGIFAATAKVMHANIIVPPPPVSRTGQSVPVYNIDKIPPDCGTIDFLATTNRIVPNFFYTGSALYRRACCYQPQPFDTFASLAEQFNHITLEQLVQFNSEAPLRADIALAIPALTYLPKDMPTSFYAAYSPLPTDSLNTIAQKFGTIIWSVALLNLSLPGIFAPGVTIKVGASSFKPGPLDSLKSAANALDLAYDKFISAIAGETGLYRTNGVVLTIFPVVPANDSGKSAALKIVAERFNLQPAGDKAVAQLLMANRSLEKFVQQHAKFAGPTGSTPIEAGAHETINTIIDRFRREQNLSVTIEELAAANADREGLLTPYSQFILPPNATNIATPITPVIPPKGAVGEQAIVFPVNVTIEMRRGQHLVAPDFRNATAVFRNTANLAPRAAGLGTSSVNLVDFAEQFEQAFAAFRLKCGAVQRDSLANPEQAAQLFAVNFGPSGISHLSVEVNDPQFYALAPLSTQLLSGTLPVRPYKSGCGFEPRVFKQFDSVDLDSWMAQFLNTVDLFLTPSYAVSAFQMPSGPTGPVSLEPQPVDGPVGLAHTAMASFQGFATGCSGGTAINGPGNYDDIVAAKEELAQQLSFDVLPILRGAGATGNYDHGVARETLAQQMLVQLSNAYTVNAIVQYPVDVQSPCVTPISPTGATGPLPPRLSGKIVPDLYVTPNPSEAGSTAVSFNDVVTDFGVSVPFLAETIGDVHGLLHSGATATYESRSYAIKQSDTLNIVANALGVSTDRDQFGHWEKWTTFVQAIANQPLLTAGDSFPVVKVTRRVYQTDTIQTMAAFFGVDAATVGEANQSLPGIFRQTKLELEGYETYPIKESDSLLTIAAAIKPNTGKPPLTVETLSLKVSSIQNLLTLGQTLYLTQVLPDITMSTTKVSLGRVGSLNGLKPLLSFLLTVKHPRQFRKLFLNLKYVVNEVEFGIRNVPGASGYQASSWLTFILPLGSGRGVDAGVRTDMEQVQIPIPLRSYPVPPTLVSQSAVPASVSIATQTPDEAIARGKEWDYRIDFQSTNAAQDINHVELIFNPFSPGGLLGFSRQARVQAVFGALAEFMDACPELVADLARLPRLSAGAVDPIAAIAVMVLDTLATNVAHALGFSAPAALGKVRWPELKYLYRLETSVAKDELAELHMVLESGPTGPVGGGPLWPQVFIQSVTGLTGSGPDAGFLPLKRFGPTAGPVANYKYPAGFPSSDLVTQRFLLPSRDVIQNQNASGGIYLTRNDDLIASGPLGSQGPTGPSGPHAPIATNRDFLYQTPLVRFINPLTPFLTVGEPINVAGLGGASGPVGPRSLAQHIENMLDAVLELGSKSVIKADSKIAILCSYGFPVAGAEELTATIPVRLVPAQFLTAELKNAFAFKLSKSIQSWPRWPGAGGPGVLIFDLSVFTVPGMTGPSGPTETLKPILQFENLRVPLANIVPGEV